MQTYRHTHTDKIAGNLKLLITKICIRNNKTSQVETLLNCARTSHHVKSTKIDLNSLRLPFDDGDCDGDGNKKKVSTISHPLSTVVWYCHYQQKQIISSSSSWASGGPLETRCSSMESAQRTKVRFDSIEWDFCDRLFMLL